MLGSKPFSLVENRYDQSTYLGRVRHFFDAVNPMILLYNASDLADATALIERYKENGCKHPEGVTDADLWKARRIRESVLHPDTGEPIPVPFRMSAFVPVNIPIAAGMILSTATMPQLFFQWVNQSYNSGFNYANRNATVAVDNTEMAVSYGLAVSVACGSAFLGGRIASRLSASPRISAGAKVVVKRVVPWFAVAAAGSFNAVAMRYKEAVEGVEVRDASGDVRGVSRRAGIAVLGQVVTTRVVIPIPIILIPPFLGDAIKSIGVVGRAVAASATAGLAVDLLVITGCLWLALPLAVALFPQKATLPVSALEEEFQGLLDRDGRPVEEVTCNKGL